MMQMNAMKQFQEFEIKNPHIFCIFEDCALEQKDFQKLTIFTFPFDFVILYKLINAIYLSNLKAVLTTAF